MKLAHNTGPVKVSGNIGSQTTFNIAASGTAFKTLSSGLYNNKIKAVLRELCCNAWDSHVAAGTQHIPFELHLPTSFEPSFTIRDFGTGLEYREKGCESCGGEGHITVIIAGVSHEQDCASCDATGDYDAVKELYCTYFASNKNNSNLFIGALGLGSKSPFSYTEGFSVTNVYNGVTRIYSCFLNDEGMPATVLQDVTVTPEARNGVEVTFPANQQDIQEFENQARQVLEFFPTRPDINVDINIRKVEYSLRKEKWGLRVGMGGKPRAIMGLVPYDIGSIDSSRLNDVQKRLIEQPLDLFFNIGDLSVAASREALSNDEQTISNIISLLDEVSVELLSEAKARIAACRTAWEARLTIFELTNASGIGPLVKAAYNRGEFDRIYTGFELVSRIPVVNQLDYLDLAVFEFHESHRSNATTARKDRITQEIDTPYDMVKLNKIRDKYRLEFEAKKSTPPFIINDVGNSADRYVHYAVQVEQLYDPAYLITGRHKNIRPDRIVSEARRMIAELGHPPNVVYVSDLKAQYKANRQPVEKAEVRKLFWFNEVTCRRYFDQQDNKGASPKGWRAVWENALEKLDSINDGEVKHYVVLRNLEPVGEYFDDARRFKRFIELTRKFKDLGVMAETIIYGVPFWMVRKLGPEWVELTGHTMTYVKDRMTPEKEAAMSLTINKFESALWELFSVIAKKKLLAEDSPLRQFSDQLIDADRRREQDDKLLKQLVDHAVAMGEHTVGNVIDFNKLWEPIATEYPLLAYLEAEAVKNHSIREHVLNYIEMVDQQRAAKALDTFALGPAAEAPSEAEDVTIQ
jgi:hypothetical protein